MLNGYYRQLMAAMPAQPEPEAHSIRSLIARELQLVAIEHGRTLAPLTDELKLLESGLDSLGIDPFGSGKSAASPVTFGEFARVYESSRG